MALIFCHWCDNYQRSVVKNVPRSHELSWMYMNCWLPSSWFFERASRAMNQLKGWCMVKAMVEMMRLDVRGANTCLWLRCSSTIQWSYGNTHLPGYLVPLWDHLGRVINRSFYPCNFDKSPQALQFNLNSLYLNSHPSWPVRTHQFHSSKPAPGFEIPPTKGDAQLELAVGFTQLLADTVELQALVDPNESAVKNSRFPHKPKKRFVFFLKEFLECS